MAAAPLSPLPLYRPRDPQASDLWRLVDRHFETFSRVYDERFQRKYGYWRPVVERSVRAYLRCGWHCTLHWSALGPPIQLLMMIRVSGRLSDVGTNAARTC